VNRAKTTERRSRAEEEAMDTRIELNVKASDGRTAVVRVDGYDTLTPAAARAAVDVAFGYAATATVDDGITTYRVSRNRVRLLHPEPEFSVLPPPTEES
jgi:hypothetical protein